MSVRAAPSLMGEVTAATPARIAKRLDADRAIARRWTWDETATSIVRVTTDTGEIVTLTAASGLVSTLADVACTCLLSPRCFHVLAVAASLPIADADADAEAGKGADAAPSNGIIVVPDAAATAKATELDQDARRVATEAWLLASEVIVAGAQSLGAVHEGAILRVVHLARVHGLHRLSRAGLRFVRNLRELRDNASSFDTYALVDDLADFAGTAMHVANDAHVDARHLGVSRRQYEPAGNLRLVGICCEAVVARAGYGGIVTHLVDERGGLWSIGDVLPGGVDRARGAYDATISMGETSLTHRELARASLLVQDATASIDRRLGAGKNVKAVTGATRVSAWSDDAIRALFAQPLPEQLRAAHGAFAVPEEERPRGATCVFARGTLVGHDAAAVLLRTDAGVLRLVPATDGEALADRDNLRQLARAVGVVLDVVGSVDPRRPSTLRLIAFDAGRSEDATEPAALHLPAAFGGVVNSSYDRLVGVTAGKAPLASALVAEGRGEPIDPLAAMRRRVVSVALNGARAVAVLPSWMLERDVGALRDGAMPTGGRTLGAMFGRATDARGDRRELGRAWLGAHTFERGAGAAWRSGA